MVYMFIETALNVGATRIESISYHANDADVVSVRREALRQAISQAYSKANVISDQLTPGKGMQLVEIQEDPQEEKQDPIFLSYVGEGRNMIDQGPLKVRSSVKLIMQATD